MSETSSASCVISFFIIPYSPVSTKWSKITREAWKVLPSLPKQHAIEEKNKNKNKNKEYNFSAMVWFTVTKG